MESNKVTHNSQKQYFCFWQNVVGKSNGENTFVNDFIMQSTRSFPCHFTMFRAVHTNDNNNYTNIYLNISIISADCVMTWLIQNYTFKRDNDHKSGLWKLLKHVNQLIIVLLFYVKVNSLSFVSLSCKFALMTYLCDVMKSHLVGIKRFYIV